MTPATGSGPFTGQVSDDLFICDGADGDGAASSLSG